MWRLLPSGRHHMLDYPAAALEEISEGWQRCGTLSNFCFCLITDVLNFTFNEMNCRTHHQFTMHSIPCPYALDPSAAAVSRHAEILCHTPCRHRNFCGSAKFQPKLQISSASRKFFSTISAFLH